MRIKSTRVVVAAIVLAAACSSGLAPIATIEPGLWTNDTVQAISGPWNGTTFTVQGPDLKSIYIVATPTYFSDGSSAGPTRYYLTPSSGGNYLASAANTGLNPGTFTVKPITNTSPPADLAIPADLTA